MDYLFYVQMSVPGTVLFEVTVNYAGYTTPIVSRELITFVCPQRDSNFILFDATYINPVGDFSFAACQVVATDLGKTGPFTTSTSTVGCFGYSSGNYQATVYYGYITG